MALQEIPLLEFVEHLQPLDARLLTGLVQLRRVDAIHADRLEMHHVKPLALHNTLHPLHLRISRLAILDAKKLAASVLEIFDHHAAKLVIWMDHFVVYIHYIALSTEEVHRPADHVPSVLAPHVDEQAFF